MITMPELFLIVASYIVVAGVAARLGHQTGAEKIRPYREGK